MPGESVTYTLDVAYLNGEAETRSVTVPFVDTTSDQHIEYFYVDRTEISPGECVNLAYRVVGAQHTHQSAQVFSKYSTALATKR